MKLRLLLLGRKVMTNLDSILKSRDITLPAKVRLVKARVFPVVMYDCESWTVKKAVWKKWCFWIVVLEKTLESPLACKEIQTVHPKGNQSWIFIGRTDAEPETPNTLTIWCKELTHLKRPWCREWLKAGGEGDGRGWDGWMASRTQWTWVWVHSGRWWWKGAWCAALHGVAESRTQLSDRTEIQSVERLSTTFLQYLSSPWLK